MCGRFQLTLPAEAIRSLFAAEGGAPFPPRWNIAPTQPVHVVREGSAGRELTLMRWGFTPGWVKDPAKFPFLINARAETAAEKPAFRNALRRRRVLLPATGFYEWKTEGKAKTPYLFEPDGTMALAGIAETWCGPNGEEVDGVAILTGAAEGVAAAYHDRMPLTVPPGAFGLWLDPANDDAALALSLTEKARYRPRPVSRRLGDARQEGEGLMVPEPAAPPVRPKRAPLDEDDAPRFL